MLYYQLEALNMQLICGAISIISLILAFVGTGLYAYLEEKKIEYGKKTRIIAMAIVLFFTLILINIFMYSLGTFIYY